MLTAKAQCSLADAKRYFKEHLSVGDYYAEGQHVAGQWFGKGAADLGLQGVTTMEQFERLCENLHPATGQKLTLRQNATRIETGKDGVAREAANRRVFYDFTFSPPKSVSIAALVCDDKRIIAAHGQAIRTAVHELQSFAATRVRKNGQCTDRTTGNIVAAVFQHDTSRALDPHLHSHCVVFNATYDGAEKQWKALQNHDMLAAQKFVENVYYHELARELVKCGYTIENKPRGDFEIKGIAPELIEKFSKRHKQIDEKTRELLAREPDKASGNLAAIRENIAHKERPPKVRDMALSRRQAMWNDQMTARERDSLRTLTAAETPKIQPPAITAKDAVAWAEEHVFERRSVVPERELWRHALEHARGENIRLADIQAATRQRPYLRNERHPGHVTLQEHLEREPGMLLYILARSCHARTIVEFGTSFGISTLHLAAALRDNGGGRLITSEFEPSKVERARKHLTAGGLIDLVEFREGDALRTLSLDLPETIDLLLLDGAKALYSEILSLVESRLRPGALIVADNADHCPEYMARVCTPEEGYLSVSFAEDVELSMKIR